MELAWPFHLAYQARDNRALMQRFGGLRGRLLGEWYQRQALPDIVSNTSGPIRVGIVSAHCCNHSVWHAVTRGWFAHFDPGRIALHGFHVGSTSDAETAFARDHTVSFAQGKRPLAEWARTILAVRPEILIYPEVGMDNVSANLAALRLAPVPLRELGPPGNHRPANHRWLCLRRSLRAARGRGRIY